MNANPYDPYYDPNGTLYGAAAVIGSQASLMASQQQAFLTRERVREARIANRRKALDESLQGTDRNVCASVPEARDCPHSATVACRRLLSMHASL
jgi:hypothetical protein